ncbi:hypothetical protein [Photobacterium nomapromontoriensis]|uniref:hypothetical protein n=1 Tax=Photobacterium nomapromontoriensis TaxID=2910237 RepID=UPI003D0D2BAE
MNINMIVMGFAVLVLAIDKLSLFDDTTDDYVNAPRLDTYDVVDVGREVSPMSEPISDTVVIENQSEADSEHNLDQGVMTNQYRVVMGRFTTPVVSLK